MEKKQYIKPAMKVYPLIPAHIICGSGDNNLNLQYIDSSPFKPAPAADENYWGE